MTLLTRRFVIGAAACCGAMLGRPGAVAAEDRLRAILTGHPAVQSLGRAYLAAAREEPRRLPALISHSLGLGEGAIACIGDADLRRRVTARVRQDFVDGATVTVEGWLLSRTEARLAALWA